MPVPNLPFFLGFESGISAAEAGIKYGIDQTYSSLFLDLVKTVDTVGGIGRRNLRIHNLISSGARDRGILFTGSFPGAEFWFGAYIKAVTDQPTRAFLVETDYNQGPLLAIFINPLSSGSMSVLDYNAASAFGNINGTTGSLANSGPDWRFNPYGDKDHPDNPYRFVAVKLTRRSDSGDVHVYVDGVERVTATNVYNLRLDDKGPVTRLGPNAYSDSFDTDYTHHLEFDDIWLATEHMPELRVLPTAPVLLGAYEQATPSIESATPISLVEMIDDFPVDLTTYISIAEDDAVSFFLDDSPFTTANLVESLRLRLYIGGPAEYTVFAKDGANEAAIGHYVTGGTVPEEFEIDISQNPITGAPWTISDLSTVEIGIRNEANPATPT